MKKRGRPPKKNTQPNGRQKRRAAVAGRSREETILRHWANAKVYPVVRGKVQSTKVPRAARRSAENPEDEAQQPITYAIREMPTPIHTLTLSTLCRKIHQDIFLKTEMMQGHQVIYVPAWEKYPVRIEDDVAKKTPAKTPVSPSRLRKDCRTLYQERVAAQSERLHQLGNFADWDTGQKNLDFRQEAKLIPLLSRLREDRHLLDRAQLSPWCPKCIAPLDETATEQVATTVLPAYVKFPFSIGLEHYGLDVSFCVQVAHLWEIAGITELGITKNATYCITQFEGEYLLFAKQQLERFQSSLPEGAAVPEIIEEVSCDALAKSEVSHPLYPSKTLKIIAVPKAVSAYAAAMLKKNGFAVETPYSDTGVIPLNPAHDARSYYIAQKLGKSSSAIFDDAGRFTEEAGTLCGLNLYAAEKLIAPELERFGYLLQSPGCEHEMHAHHCPRCETAAVFRPCSHWVFGVAKKHPTAQELRAQIYWDNYGASEHAEMNETRKAVANFSALPVSGKRQWGMPLPILFCDECDEPLADKNTLLAIRDAVRRGADLWFRLSVEELLPADTFCPKCGSKEFRKEAMLLDSHFANLLQAVNSSDFKKPPGGLVSVAFVPQTGFSTWLAETSILCACLSRSRPIKESQPFKQFMLRNIPVEAKRARDFALDDAFFDDYPADVGRLAAIMPDINRTQMKTALAQCLLEYQELQSILEKMAVELQALGGYDSSVVKGKAISPSRETKDKHRRIDALALAATEACMQAVQQAYPVGNFHEMWRILVDFCNADLGVYARLIAKRPKATITAARRTFSAILTVLLQRLAPLTPFLAEYGYNLCSAPVISTGGKSQKKTATDAPNSIFLTRWLHLPPAQPDAKTDWESLKDELI